MLDSNKCENICRAVGFCFFPKRKERLIGYHNASNDEFKIKVKVKVKVKFTPEQAMKAQSGS
jgi:hypothetical protein